MTHPRSHPKGETLMSFAASALNPAFSLVLDCHLQFCVNCRRRVGVLEQVGGVLLEGLPVDKDEAFLLRMRERFAQEVAQPVGSLGSPARPGAGDEVIMPAPLAAATGLRRETIPWQDLGQGVMNFDLAEIARGSARARIVRIEPGAVLHSERHGGQLVLVLWGAYRCDGIRFERGDLHEIDATGFKAFASDSAEGAIFVTAIAPVLQFEILRTAH
jgi:putative transcriptional regulator